MSILIGEGGVYHERHDKKEGVWRISCRTKRTATLSNEGGLSDSQQAVGRTVSLQNLWRMKQVYEVYRDCPILSPLVRERMISQKRIEKEGIWKSLRVNLTFQ